MYNYKDVYEKTLSFFNGDELATSVWMSKYCLKQLPNNATAKDDVKPEDMIYLETSPTDMFHRLTSELYRVGLKYENPLTYDEIFELVDKFKYVVPQGRPMAGIGNNNDITSISNCFVVSYPDQDSYGTICRVDQEIAQISKRGGGIGTDLSSYRAENTKVKNAAMTSTGPVEICANRFSATIREVGQNGRRGALMLSMDINHKDSEKFIDAKMEEGKVTGANISVKIPDFWLKSFIDNENPNKENERLWNKIIHNAWKSAEPGVLFWDTIIRESVPDCYEKFGFKTLSTNPCVTRDSWVMTDSGPKLVNDLIGKSFIALVDGKKYNSKNGFFYTGDKLVYELETESGLKIKTTGNHKFKKVLSNKRGKKEFEWVELDNLKAGDTVNLNNNKLNNYDWKLGNVKDKKIGWLIGSLVGDGSLVNDTAYLRYWGENRSELKEIAVSYIKDVLKYSNKLGTGCDDNNIITLQSNDLGKIANSLGLANGKNLGVEIERQSTEFYCGLISGILDSDGCVLDNIEKGINVRLSSSNINNLEVIQRLLLRLGIKSSIYKNRRLEGKRLLPDGKGGLKLYKTKSQHELSISKNNILVFNERIGFKDKNKQTKLDNALLKLNRGLYKEYFTDKVKNITAINFEDVYDCTIDDIHEFDCNGFSVHNCGEIPLSNKDSCRLILINLYSYVINPFTDKAEFDFDLLRKHARRVIKIMDNMIDLEIEKIDSIINKIISDPEDEETKAIELNLWKDIKKVAILGRRSGVGVTAEGDMLAAMGLRYGTKEATEFATKVHKIFSTNVYIGSCDLVQEDNRPSFGCFNWELEKENPFINRLINDDDIDSIELRNKINKGRRNIACLTIPPAGSVSLMTQTTSGIEPAFLIYYKRKRKIDKNSGIKADFIDENGDWFQEYFVIHPKFVTWYSVKRNIDINEAFKELSLMDSMTIDSLFKESPYYGATSADVNWVEKVKMQGSIQRFVDHSISCTTNTPKDTTEDTVRQIYEAAWKSGCKGMTIYREGSRSGVLTSTTEIKKTQPEEYKIKKRPKSVKGKVVRFNNGGEKWVSVIGLIDDEPYEIFTGLLHKLNIPKYVEEGYIVKEKEVKLEFDENNQEVEILVSRYDFQYKNKDNENITVVGLSKTFKEEYWNYAKLISGLLRNGMPIKYVVKTIASLNLDSQSINTWKNGVIRTLKRFIKDGTDTGEICPSCGGKLVRNSGCMACQDCGWSKCS